MERALEDEFGWEVADRVGSCWYAAWELARVRQDVAAVFGKRVVDEEPGAV